MVGDGSGVGWNTASGFAGVLIDRLTRARKTIWGGLSSGSCNQAEVSPYWFGLTWYHSQTGKARLRTRSPLHVHIITDSQVTVSHGLLAADFSKELPHVPQRPIWAGMREFGRMGYQLHWHWAARDTTALNAMADLLAGLSRVAVRDIEEPDDLAARAAEVLAGIQFLTPNNVYEVNSDE